MALPLLFLLLISGISVETHANNCQEISQKLTQTLSTNAFKISRGLEDYERQLGHSFTKAVADLGPKDQWIDMGAGHARAMTEYVHSDFVPLPDSLKNALGGKKKTQRLSAVAFQRPPIEETRLSFPELPLLSDSELRYISGRYVEDIPVGELGRAKLITDVFGPTSYSTRVKGLEVDARDAWTFAVRPNKNYSGLPNMELVEISDTTPPRRVFRIVQKNSRLR